MDRIKGAFGRFDKYSLDNGHRLCDAVENMNNALIGITFTNNAKKAKLIERVNRYLRELTEVLIWMDRHREEWFERIMERDVMNTFECLITNGLMPASVKQQSLQSVTLLLQNLSRVPSVYYICSNNHINRMVAVEFDVLDDEFVSLFVSFLKSLALRCTSDTVQFFFDVQSGAFPLWDRAARLLNSDDAMVRTAAKQIIAMLTQVQDTAVARFVSRSIDDVFHSVLRFVDSRLMDLAASVPSWGALMTHGGSGSATATPTPMASLSASPPPTAPAPKVQPLLFNTRAVTIHLEDVQDELLYLNDLCRSPVAEAGEQAAASLQRTLFPRFRSIILEELAEAERMATAATTDVARNRSPLVGMHSSGGPTHIPGQVILAFLVYWSHVNTVSHVARALADFLLLPCGSSPSSIGQLVLESSRVDLHESVVMICQDALMRWSSTSPAPQTRAPLLRFPESLSQFFYAETPYQQTGRVLVGGPTTTALLPKASFVEVAWPPLAGAQPSACSALTALLPCLFSALHAQLKYFHVTRLRCWMATLSFLLDLAPGTVSTTSPALEAKRWTNAYVELMKLLHRQLLSCVKQYASAIQSSVQEQLDADHAVPLSRISFQDFAERGEDEAPLPIYDPYAAMFLTLQKAASSMESLTSAPASSCDEKKVCAFKDLHLLFPVLPRLFDEENALVLEAWPPLLPLASPPLHRTSLGTQTYQAARENAVHAFDLAARSPATDAECELNLYRMFLLTRQAFSARLQKGGTDLLLKTLQHMSPLPSAYFTLAESTTVLTMRCELTWEWDANGSPASTVPLGTPLCVVLPKVPPEDIDRRALLLLKVASLTPKGVRAEELLTGMHKRRVLRSFNLAFVGLSIHPQYPFKVILSYQLPGHFTVLHLVTTSEVQAQALVTDVEKAANECRRRGASFCFGLMNYRSAILAD